jgi:hypothetical protein
MTNQRPLSRIKTDDQAALWAAPLLTALVVGT